MSERDHETIITDALRSAFKRKLVVSAFMTLDGVMEAPGGEPGHPHSGWVFDFISDEQLRNKWVEILEADGIVIGRKTYESFAGAWPGRKGDFADRMNALKKYVASTTLQGELWNNSEQIRSDLPGAIAALKSRAGGPLVVMGSGSVVHQLLRAGLVDELRVMLFPVLVGSGLRLFPEGPEKVSLKLTETCTFRSGVSVLTYAVG
jgi:dihydrofolate reductase